MMLHIQIRLTGKTGEVDGYAELISGMMIMAGMLRGQKLGKRQRPNGITQIYMDLDVKAPPLGHLGELDIPPYEGDTE